jgi:hypothetical protein
LSECITIKASKQTARCLYFPSVAKLTVGESIMKGATYKLKPFKKIKEKEG